MKQKIDRKGQTEDIFADFMIAMVIIIITLVTVAVYEKSIEKSTTAMAASGMAALEELDLITKLRAPLMDEQLLQNPKYQSMSFAEVMAAISEGNEEKYPEIFGEEGLAVKRGNTYYCTERFKDLLLKQRVHQRFDEELWPTIRVYDNENKKIFECAKVSDIRKEGRSEQVTGSIDLPLKNKESIRLEVAE